MVGRRSAGGADISLGLSEPSHILLTGATRSGKSSLLYSLLMRLSSLSSVIVAGVDPTGILFNALFNALGGRDMRALTLRQPERCIEVLDDLVQLMDSRIQTLLDQRKDKINEFSPSCPLVLVVLEEYPALLAGLDAYDKATGSKPGHRLADRARSDVQRLAMESAKAGFRLIVVCQRGDASLLPAGTRDQLTTRIAFRQNRDGLRMNFEDLPAELVERAAAAVPGRGLLIQPGMTEPVEFAADFATYEQFVARFALA